MPLLPEDKTLVENPKDDKDYWKSFRETDAHFARLAGSPTGDWFGMYLILNSGSSRVSAVVSYDTVASRWKILGLKIPLQSFP